MRRHGLLEQAQKLEPFLVPMPFLTKSVDLAVGRIEGDKQSGGAGGVCSRGSWSGCGRASAAVRVGYDPRLGSDFSHPLFFLVLRRPPRSTLFPDTTIVI